MFSVCVEGRQIEGGPPAFQNLQGTTRALGLLNVFVIVFEIFTDRNLSTAPAPSFNHGDRSKVSRWENFDFGIEPQK